MSVMILFNPNQFVYTPNLSCDVSRDVDLYSVGDRLCLVGDVWLMPSLDPIMNGDSLPKTDPGLSPKLAS